MAFRDPVDTLPKRTIATPSSEQLAKNLDAFESRWTQIPGSPVNEKTNTEITKLRKHISQGCLSDIPPGIGTNVNENIHKQLKEKVSTYRKGVPYAIASFGRFFYDWNQQIVRQPASSTLRNRTQKIL